jgi:N-acylneuraminate cytidylyltransferase
MSDVIAFIFARSGSKGLANKNIRNFAGKPLIAWSIEHAKSVSRIRRIIVSTDSEEIASIAKEYGAEVPFLRPKELATDESPEWLSWQHALNFVIREENKLPDVMISLPVTAPLRKPLDVDNCLDCFYLNKADVVVTVTDAHRSPYFNMIKLRNNGLVELVIKAQKNIKRRQDAPLVFDMTTVAYVAKPKFVLDNNSLFSGNVYSVNIPVERSIDIDTLFDFEIAEFLFQRYKA